MELSSAYTIRICVEQMAYRYGMMPLEHIAHGGAPVPVAQLGQFTVDPPVASARTLTRQAEGPLFRFRTGAWSALCDSLANPPS